MNKRLELLGIFLIIVVFVIGQITPTPLDFGISLMVARWLGILVGVCAIGLRYIPTPRPLDPPPAPSASAMLAITDPRTDALAAQVAALTASIGAQPSGGGTDPQVQQVLDQNSLLADADFYLEKALEAIAASASPAEALAQARTKINALNPPRFDFTGADPKA